MEVHVAGLEVELRLSSRNVRVLLVLRVEPEVGAALQGRVGRVRGGRHVDPATAGDEAGRGVVHDDPNGRTAAGGDAVVDTNVDRVHTGSRELVRGREGRRRGGC